jgi:hypothetical protein
MSVRPMGTMRPAGSGRCGSRSIEVELSGLDARYESDPLLLGEMENRAVGVARIDEIDTAAIGRDRHSTTSVGVFSHDSSGRIGRLQLEIGHEGSPVSTRHGQLRSVGVA